MITLKYLLAQLVAPYSAESQVYASELGRAVVRRAPDECEVVGYVPNAHASALQRIRDRVPGLAELHTLPVSAGAVSRSWSLGMFTGAIGDGLVHSPSLTAPMYPSERAAFYQTVVTVPDGRPWMHPESLPQSTVRVQRALLRRAWRFASAVVVPSHALATELMGQYDFGERLRVIPPGARDIAGALPDSPAVRERVAETLGLPGRYVLVSGTFDNAAALERLLRVLAQPALADVPLVIVGRPPRDVPDLGLLFGLTGFDPSRLHVLGLSADDAERASGRRPGDHERITHEPLPGPAGAGSPGPQHAGDAFVMDPQAHAPTLHVGVLTELENAVVFDRAAMLVAPSRSMGIGLLEAYAAGVPTIHLDFPELVEISQDASLVVQTDDRSTVEERLELAIGNVLGDEELRRMLVTAGHDRSVVYSWDYSGDLVWRLHADL